MSDIALMEAISCIDDSYLQTYFEVKEKLSKKGNRRYFKLIAASLTIIVCVFCASFILKLTYPKNDASSWLVVSAYAAGGEFTDLGLNDECFNSGKADESIFGSVDVPLFRFTVRPNNRKKPYSDFSITVFYNGNKVDSQIEHLVLMHSYPTSGSEASYGCEIIGWCEEPTDIVLTVTDTATGALIEEQTIHVEYITESQNYRLTVTEIRTNDKRR